MRITDPFKDPAVSDYQPDVTVAELDKLNTRLIVQQYMFDQVGQQDRAEIIRDLQYAVFNAHLALKRSYEE